MGVAVLVAVWTRIKVLSSSLFSARHQSAQFLFQAVFRTLNDLKKIVRSEQPIINEKPKLWVPRSTCSSVCMHIYLPHKLNNSSIYRSITHIWSQTVCSLQCPHTPVTTGPPLFFAECLIVCTRQRQSRAPHTTVTPLPPCCHERYTVRRPLPLWFAECQAGDTRQNFLCRVAAVRHSAKLCECRVQ